MTVLCEFLELIKFLEIHQSFFRVFWESHFLWSKSTSDFLKPDLNDLKNLGSSILIRYVRVRLLCEFEESKRSLETFRRRLTLFCAAWVLWLLNPVSDNFACRYWTCDNVAVINYIRVITSLSLGHADLSNDD